MKYLKERALRKQCGIEPDRLSPRDLILLTGNKKKTHRFCDAFGDVSRRRESFCAQIADLLQNSHLGRHRVQKQPALGCFCFANIRDRTRSAIAERFDSVDGSPKRKRIAKAMRFLFGEAALPKSEPWLCINSTNWSSFKVFSFSR